MSFENHPKSSQLPMAIELNKRAAEKGKDASFDEWWFFDTNCISELVKLFQTEFEEAVCEFVKDKNFLLLASTIQELRKRPDILQGIEETLQCANLYLAPDNTRFWWTDIFNFLNDLDIKMNSLQVYPLPQGFTDRLVHSQEFESVCETEEANVENLFLSRVKPDIGVNMDERDLGTIIWHTVNKYGNDWFNINIPLADCKPTNFPSFYVYFYTYYFRYIKSSTVRPEQNDFIDLANCLAAPYCQRYYSENKFTNILRLSVKGKKPPSAFQIIKRAYKNNQISYETFQDARCKKDKLKRSSELLCNTEFYKYSEMITQIKER